MQVPEKYFRNNTVNSLTLLEAMLAHKVQRLVFSSPPRPSMARPIARPLRRPTRWRPTNAYGESKLLVEQMLALGFTVIHGLRYASLRYFNAAGAAGDLGEDHVPESHLDFLSRCKSPSENVNTFPIFGTDYPTPDGTCISDYIHVSDSRQRAYSGARCFAPARQAHLQSRYWPRL